MANQELILSVLSDKIDSAQEQYESLLMRSKQDNSLWDILKQHEGYMRGLNEGYLMFKAAITQ